MLRIDEGLISIYVVSVLCASLVGAQTPANISTVVPEFRAESSPLSLPTPFIFAIGAYVVASSLYMLMDIIIKVCI